MFFLIFSISFYSYPSFGKWSKKLPFQSNKWAKGLFLVSSAVKCVGLNPSISAKPFFVIIYSKVSLKSGSQIYATAMKNEIKSCL